jgi:hypothetical protein
MALAVAGQQGHLRAVEVLLDAGAVWHKDVIDRLLEAGVDISQPGWHSLAAITQAGIRGRIEQQGNSALFFAAMYDQ